MSSIKRLSSVLVWILTAAILITIIFFITFWINPVYVGTILENIYLSTALQSWAMGIAFIPNFRDLGWQWPLMTHIIAMLWSAAYVSLFLAMLWQLRQLFKLYQAGIIFSLRNGLLLKHAAYFLLLQQIAYPVYQFFMTLILSWYRGPEHRFAFVAFNSINVSVVMCSLIFLVIAYVMQQAEKLKLENDLTI